MLNMKKYEILYIIKSNIEEKDKEKTILNFNEILKKFNVKIIKSEFYKKAKLSYNIKKNKEGIFYIIEFFSSNSNVINEMNRLLKINKNIIRYIILRKGKINDK